MNKSHLLVLTLDDNYVGSINVIPELIASKFYRKGTLALMLLQSYLCFLQRDEVLRKNLKLIHSHISSFTVDC